MSLYYFHSIFSYLFLITRLGCHQAPTDFGLCLILPVTEWSVMWICSPVSSLGKYSNILLLCHNSVWLSICLRVDNVIGHNGFTSWCMHWGGMEEWKKDLTPAAGKESTGFIYTAMMPFTSKGSLGILLGEPTRAAIRNHFIVGLSGSFLCQECSACLA